MKTKQDSDPDRTTDPADAVRFHRHLLGDLAPEEFAKLESDLIASPGLRAKFMRAVRMDVDLREQPVGAFSGIPVDRARSPWLRTASVVAAIAALLLLAAMVVWRTTPALKSAPTRAEVATLVDVRGCQWAKGTTLAPDRRISTGMLELTAGVAIFQFDGGSRLALQGPALLEIIGPKTARLHRGNATVRCEDGLYNFSLLTPTSRVVDLGTEFGVAVAADGTAEVHVLDGAVEVTETVSQSEQPGVRFLEEGQTLALGSDGAENFLTDTTHLWVRDYSSPLDREAQAEPPRLLARDPFPIDREQAKPLSLGSGWGSTWWQATDAKVAGSSFVPMAPLTRRDGSSGLALKLGWTEMRRKLAQPIDPELSQTVYVGLSMQRMFPNRRDSHGRLSDATFMLRSSQDPMTVLGLGLSPLNYWVVAEAGGWERADEPERRKGPFFLIAKIEFNPQTGNRVSMKAYGMSATIPDTEPKEWDFVTRRQHTKMTSPLDTVALRVRTSPFKFGELSLGNSWQAVTRPAAVEK